MKKYSLNRICISIILLVILGCNPFAPALVDSGSQPGIITAQKTPDEVLTNFQYAYIYQDSLIYSDVLDSSFLFISKNYGTTPPTDINWGRDVDIRATAGMFRHFKDQIDLTWDDKISERFVGDSTEYEIKILFQLTMGGGVDIPTIRGEALFNFRKNPSDIWKITRWEDLSSF
jgi:hypothetical protein